MSAPLTFEAVLFRQRLLRQAGYYQGDLDGEAGPKTSAAERKWDERYRALRFGDLDERSEHLLWGILPVAQEKVRQFLGKVKIGLANRTLFPEGLTVKIISGTRTYPEQSAIYAQGRTKPGDRVTNARAGQSLHNFGIAVDIGVFQLGKYYTGTDLYQRIGALLPASLGLEWGGAWKGSIVDRPHYQLATGLSTKELRRRFEEGEPFLD